MKAAWLGRRLLCCAAAAAAASLPPAATAQAVPPDGPAPLPATPAQTPSARRLRWDRVCSLSLVDGRISLKCDLTADVLRALDGKPVTVDGLAGSTSLTILSRQYEARNRQHAGDADQTLWVRSTRSTLVLGMSRPTGGKNLEVVFQQSNGDYNRRASGRTDDCQLRVFGTAAPGDDIRIEATDVATLRAEHPHEVNRYLRPLLRRLGADLFRVQPAAARQVLFVTDDDDGGDNDGGATSSRIEAGTRPAAGTDPSATGSSPATRPWGDAATVAAVVRTSLADLDAPAFVRRQAAADRLAALGPPAVAALARVDPKRLSAQQALEVDLLAAAVRTLPPDEARRLRSDVHFLFDCLYTPDAAVRAAAAQRLSALTKARPEKLARALSAGEGTDADALDAAIEDLREELAPRPK